VLAAVDHPPPLRCVFKGENAGRHPKADTLRCAPNP
jgi:hypothetical protein